MQVGDIVRKISYKSRMPFGCYYQIMRIGLSSIFARFVEGCHGTFTLCKKDMAKHYTVYSHRRVLISEEEFNKIFPKNGSVPKLCTYYAKPTKTMIKIAELCSDPKKKPAFLIFGSRYSKKLIVMYDRVDKKIINGEPFIRFTLERIVGIYE